MEKKAGQKKSLCPGTKEPGSVVSPKPQEEEGCPGETKSLRDQDKGAGHDWKEVKLGAPLQHALSPHQTN